MSRTMRSVLLAVTLGAGIVAGLALGRAFDGRYSSAHAALPLAEPPAALVNLQDSFHAVATTVMPSVVHITTQSGEPDDLFQSTGVGSGVIVSKEGHIITNNHVVDTGLQRVPILRVRLSDGREFTARVLGSDPETDLALLRIEPKGELVPAAFADSDKVRQTDWCLAIGSPFGYNHTITAGIVSAKHRRAELSLPYQDFIQTDAAINPGNSGGALVNLRGEVIGISTAIVSQTRGNDGVGLAISSNLVKWVVERLRKDGRVRRGYLGIRPDDFDARLVEALRQEYGIKSMEDLLEELGLKEPRGVFVSLVEADTPASRGGVKDKDVILEFNGEAVAGKSDMFFKTAKVSPGTTVTLKVLRDKKEKELKVEVGERKADDLRRPRRR